MSALFDEQPVELGEPASAKTMDLSPTEAMAWRGKWDIIITYPNEKLTGDPQHSTYIKKQKRMKRRDMFVRRMRKCGLVVVRQISMDESFVMLKITAAHARLEQEADRLDINLPLKSKAHTDMESGADLLKTWWRAWQDIIYEKQQPVEICYDRFDPSIKKLFATVDDRFFRSMDRQRLIISILETEKWRAGCSIDLDKEIRDSTFSSVVHLRTVKGQQRIIEKWLVVPWYRLSQPLTTIRDYFGEKIAFYFAFISLYTKWLVYLSLFGVITFFVCWLADGKANTLNLDHDINIFYGIILCLWCTLFLEYWKRQQAALAFKFNVTDFAQMQVERPEFKGKIVKGRVTANGLIIFEQMADITPEQLDKIDEYVMWSPPVIRFFKYMVGTPIVTTFAAAVIIGTFALLALRTFLTRSGMTGGSALGSVLNAIFIIFMNVVYQRVARILNNFENHRTDQDFENALIAKTFVFQFINSYIALFFIAFVKGTPVPSWAKKDVHGNKIDSSLLPREFRQSNKIGGYDIGDCVQSSCMLDLFYQLAIIVIVKQLLSNFAEILLPWLMGKFTFLRKFSEASKKEQEKLQQQIVTGVNLLDDDAAQAAVKKEITEEVLQRMPDFEQQVSLAKYGGTFEEYNELMIQFGYMTLFATSFPLASLFSLINNVIEIRLDAGKILFATQRPKYEGACDIGTYLTVLEFMNFLAVITNTAIICFTSNCLKGTWLNRTKAEYLSCALGCAPHVTNSTTDWNSFLANSTGHDAWLNAAAATDSLYSADNCLLACACTGRCLDIGQRFLIFVVAEHLILFLKLGIDVFIPDVPKSIARAMVWKDVVGNIVKLDMEKEKAGVTVFDDWDSNKDSADDNTREFYDSEEEDPEKKIHIKIHALAGKVEYIQGRQVKIVKGNSMPGRKVSTTTMNLDDQTPPSISSKVSRLWAASSKNVSGSPV
eukprot:c11587_g1_i1.p1 GENE.c11587_g1_i1~~c11587_g1_i1.p1  ORF type:complete len:942 (+),score=288.64 c11587_g1_i1:34-2859(+)